MTHVHFTVHEKPKPKPAARRGRFGQMYLPQEAKEYMEKVRLSIAPDKILEMEKRKHLPVSVIMICHFAPPNKISPLRRNDFIAKNRHVKKPDFDNLEKMIMDSLKGVAWNDDSQIFKCTTIKDYAPYDSVEITISYYDEIQEQEA